MNGLRQKTFRALQWSYLSFFLNLLLSPLLAAILARLLTKEEFGLFAIGLSLYAVGQYIADFGIGVALVQKRELTDEDIRAGFTASLGLGLLATTLAWLVAPLAGQFFKHPEVVPLFRAFACLYVLASLATVSTSLLRRSLRFRPLMLAEVGSYVIGQGVFGLGAAALGFGAFSLVISAGVQYLIQFSVSYAYGKHSFGLTFRRASYRHLYTFGGRVSLISFLEFLSNNLDTFMIGRLYGTATLGLYNRGYNIVYAPMMSLARSLNRVLAPSLSTIQHDQPKLRGVYLSGLLALSTLLFSAAAVLFVSAREVVLVLLGDSFVNAVPIMQMLALFIPFAVLSSLSSVLAEATAHLSAKILIQCLYLLGLAAAFWSVYKLGWGVTAFAGVLVVAGACRSAAYAVVAHRIIGGGGVEIVRAYAVGLACGLGTGTVMFGVLSALRTAGIPLLALFALELLIGAGLLASVVLFGPPSELQRLARPLPRALTERLRRWLSTISFPGKRT
jgi:lipopolysaccharide exporter